MKSKKKILRCTPLHGFGQENRIQEQKPLTSDAISDILWLTEASELVTDIQT